MYALRYHNMFVRAKDGLMTENKASAMLFNTPEEATKYCIDWKMATAVDVAVEGKVELVEVEVKPTISKVGKVVSIL